MRGKPSNDVLLASLDKIAYNLDKTYLSRLHDDYGVLKFDKYNESGAVALQSNIRVVRILRWVYDREESIGDRFKNILSLFAENAGAVAMIVRRTPQDAEVFFALRNEGIGRAGEIQGNIELFADAIAGNFNGTETRILPESENNLFGNGCKSISSLCNIPSEKSEDFISQGIDKLLNGIVPQSDSESYTVVILAESLQPGTIRQIINGYEIMAGEISPFAEYQYQSGSSETETDGASTSESHAINVSDAVAKAHSFNVGIGGAVITGVCAAGGALVGGPAGAVVGAAIAKSLNFGYGYSRTKTHTEGTTDTTMTGTNWSLTKGTNEGETYTYKSYQLTGLLGKLEKQIERTQNGLTTGLWKCASYVLAENARISRNVAGFLRALSQGDQSYTEPSFINEWSFSQKENTEFNDILSYLRHFTHPVFINIEDKIPITATSNVSTTELSDVMAFPRNSVAGLPVVGVARFGRDVMTDDFEPINAQDLPIGHVYHMRKRENKPVKLSKNSLTAHTFITGSTGSGKSRAIYRLLSNLCPEGSDDVHFLVVEPAKGEYKDVFGGRSDVSCYGTNPDKMKLLHINPFEFPDEIHVLEHIDRLVEVFNACWPMYAAMPAILKDAIETSYEQVGWSLNKSICISKVFPTFNTLLDKLDHNIEKSQYSKDTKSDYKGALITRVESLTKGIHGQIFRGKSISDDKLFNKNAIVDLSRVGSPETKSLIMGILVLKLQEWRMAETDRSGSDNDLRHITVLEEAHHLLRRTSTDQSQESSNLQGKSVEMLSTAIAEMRTYGEGFIIADQSPGIMDMSVVRNTNTKIILRLPDESDRQLVGRAAGLNDEQIQELTKLKTRVAAVYQNNWLEPILCEIDTFDDSEKNKFSFIPDDDTSEAVQKFFKVAMGLDEPSELLKEDVDAINRWLENSNINHPTEVLIQRVLDGLKLNQREREQLVYNTVDGKRLAVNLIEPDLTKIKTNINNKLGITDAQLSELILRNLLDVYRRELPNDGAIIAKLEPIWGGVL